MKAIICLNGEKLTNYKFNDDCFIIACDGGYEYLTRNNIKPNLIVGDFDSLGYIPEGGKVFPVDKDLTDGEIGLMEAIKIGASYVEFICCGGLRDDQFFANLGLLVQANKYSINAKAVTNSGEIYFFKDKISINVNIGQIISFCPMEETMVKCSKGLKYKFPNRKILIGETIGVSNVATSKNVEIELTCGSGYLFVNKI